MSKTKQTALAAALVQLTTPVAEPVTVAAAPKAKAKGKTKTAPVLDGRALFEAYISPEQCDAVEDFAALSLDRELENDSFRAQCRVIMARIFPTPVAYATWKPVIGGIVKYLGASPGMSFRTAYKALHGALPNAGTGTKGGTKGMSAKRWANGFASKVAELVEYADKMPAKDIDAGIVKRILSLVDAATKTSAAVKEAVNE